MHCQDFLILLFRRFYFLQKIAVQEVHEVHAVQRRWRIWNGKETQVGRLEQQQRFVDESNQVDAIPDDISITELAEDVVRGKRKLSQPQMRMLIELLPYYAPKLTAVAVGWQKGEDFYTRLDKAVNASEKARLIIEAKAIPINNDDPEVQ